MKKIFVYSAVLMLFSFASCDEGSKYDPDAGGFETPRENLLLTSNSLTFAAAEATRQVTVITQSENIELSSNQPWCRPAVITTADGRAVTVTVDNNPQLEGNREATVTVTAFGINKTLAVTQLPPQEEFLPKDVWRIVDFSTEETVGEGSNGRAAQAIDGNEASYWHTRWMGGNVSGQYPHWIIIDLRHEVTPSQLVSFKRGGTANNGPSQIMVEGSIDLQTWHDFGTFDLVANQPAGQICELENSQKVRAIRYSVLASPSGHAQVRNIEVRALLIPGTTPLPPLPVAER